MTRTTALSVFAAIVLSVIAHTAIAQQGQWMFGTPAIELSERITKLSSGDFVSCGDRVVTRHNATSMAIDWMVSVDGFYPKDVIETSDNNIAAAGFHIIGNTLATMLVKFDANGAMLWQHLYPGDHTWDSLDLIETHNGGFLIAGKIREPVTSFIRPYLIMADSSGAPIWMKRYDMSDLPELQGTFTFVEEEVVQDDTVRYHMTGRVRKDQLTSSYETLLMSVDDAGMPLQSGFVGFENHTDYGRGLLRVGNEFLVTGYSKEIGEGGGTYLMRTMADFTVLWYYGIQAFTGSKEIVLDSNDDAMLVGTVGFPNPIRNTALVAFNTSFLSLSWGMQYGGQLQETGSDFTIDAGGYALLGSTDSFSSGTSDMYLVRTDANGNSGCNETDFIPQVVSQEMRFVPLPLSPFDIDEIQQIEVESIDVEFVEKPLCEEPPDPCVCVDPPLDMVGWWTLDELVGPIAADSVAGNDGTYVSNPIPSPGKVDNCLDFDGIDDYVLIPDNSLLDYVVPDELTIDAWIYLDGTDPVNFEPIFSRLNSNSPSMGYAFSVHNDRLEMYLGGIIQHANWAGTMAVPNNEWVHVAVVSERFTAANYGVTFYINGVAEGPFGFPALPISPIIPAADARIGGIPFEPLGANTEHFFDGKIDEVEVFNRALDASEIQALYNAGECGKCKINCDPPWDEGFCIDDTSIVVGIPVCNYSPIDANVSLSFAGLPISAGCSIDGPTNFTVVSPGNPLVVPGNQCVTVMVEIERPVQMVALNQVGCYEVTVTNLDNGHSTTCRGSVQDKRNLCPLDPDPNDDVAMVIGVPTQISIPILNTAYKSEVITWRAVAYGPNMELSDNYSLDGGEPGTSASGELETAIGEISVLRIDVMAMAFEFGYSDLVIYTQEEGELYPLTSIKMHTVIGEDCPGDFNGSGTVDGGDLGLLLSAWGKCRGCPEDLNGDLSVNGGDLGILLALFGPCP